MQLREIGKNYVAQKEKKFVALIYHFHFIMFAPVFAIAFRYNNPFILTLNISYLNTLDFHSC